MKIQIPVKLILTLAQFDEFPEYGNIQQSLFISIALLTIHKYKILYFTEQLSIFYCPVANIFIKNN